MKTTGQASREGGRERVTGRGRAAAADAAPRPPAHDRVYQILRQRVLTGGFLPGRPVTLRGMSTQLGVGVMPVREAVRRLIAERALELQDNKRVCVPVMSMEKFGEITFARTRLEAELAARARARIDAAAIGELAGIDERMERARVAGDIENYMRGDTEFHFAIYRRAQAPTLLALTESVWLQMSPFMRMAYGRLGTANLSNNHREISQALRSGEGLPEAIAAEVTQGMRLAGDLAFGAQQPGTAPAAPAKPARKARAPSRRATPR